jgi:hypothetical protein
MKIRNGFVSNSSSSSFVVLFPTEPKCAEDVKNMLFTEGQDKYCSSYDDENWPTDQVAKTVWNDICEQEKNDMTRAIDIIKNGYLYGVDAPNYNDFNHIKDNHDRWEAYDNARELYADQVIKKFFNLRKLKLKKINKEPILEGVVLYCFEYSDNDGSYGSALEHGGLFENLKHITASNH